MHCPCAVEIERVISETRDGQFGTTKAANALTVWKRMQCVVARRTEKEHASAIENGGSYVPGIAARSASVRLHGRKISYMNDALTTLFPQPSSRIRKQVP